MKRFNYYFFASLLYLTTLLSCQKEKSYEYQVGNPTLAIQSDVSKLYLATACPLKSR